MPSKKRKYNARFPAGRIKKIMQTDEEVGKVAQAVPIIILLAGVPRTLELFVESLLTKAMQVTASRNAKTLSPSHVKQCILAESRFDFLKDLVKTIPDVSAAEEKEITSAENSPNSTRFTEMPVPPRRLAREDSNSSSGSDARTHPIVPAHDSLKRPFTDPDLKIRTETITSTVVSSDAVMDLSKKPDPDKVRTPNFYQETLNIQETPEVQHSSVIRVNPTYAIAQPSTSQLTLQRIELPKTPEVYKPMYHIDIKKNNAPPPLKSPRTPITPILNIDFTKNLTKPEIKVLDTNAASIVGVSKEKVRLPVQRQNSKKTGPVSRKMDPKPPVPPLIDIDHLNSGNLQIDEDYDT